MKEWLTKHERVQCAFADPYTVLVSHPDNEKDFIIVGSGQSIEDNNLNYLMAKAFDITVLVKCATETKTKAWNAPDRNIKVLDFNINHFLNRWEDAKNNRARDDILKEVVVVVVLLLVV